MKRRERGRRRLRKRKRRKKKRKGEGRKRREVRQGEGGARYILLNSHCVSEAQGGSGPFRWPSQSVHHVCEPCPLLLSSKFQITEGQANDLSIQVWKNCTNKLKRGCGHRHRSQRIIPCSSTREPAQPPGNSTGKHAALQLDTRDPGRKDQKAHSSRIDSHRSNWPQSP